MSAASTLTRFRLSLGNLQSDLSRDAADGPFELTHAGFARVARGDQFNRLVGNCQLFRLQSILFNLTRNQIPFGNLQLLPVAIAGNRNHFHAIAQRRRNRTQSDWRWR